MHALCLLEMLGQLEMDIKWSEIGREKVTNVTSFFLVHFKLEYKFYVDTEQCSLQSI